MSEGSNLVVLVSSDNSYLMTALMDKMALKRIRTVNSKSEISVISAIKEKIDAFMIYANTAMVDEDILVYLRDKADEEDIPVILIGDDYFIAEIEKIINEHFIDNIFRHPINTDAIASYMVTCIESHRTENKPKILVVDDSADMLKRLKMWLSDNYQIIMAKSGTMAIKYLTMEKPDLILLDYEMPIINGQKVMEMIRSEKDFASIPIIFLTACSDRNTVMEIAKLKPEGYLLKTQKPTEIISTIDAFFAKKKEEKL
jgi:CheY-like chemotaxis protein